MAALSDKPHKCMDCGKSFKAKSNLTAHVTFSITMHFYIEHDSGTP